MSPARTNRKVSMNKKLMLLAAAALAALAFAVLPVVASAGEFEHHCKSGNNCTALITGGAAELENDGTESISCTSVTGNATLTTTTSTGHVVLTFHGCRETETIFKFSCTSAGQPSGTIKTNTLTSHNVYLKPNKVTPALLLTGVNVTFTCAGGFSQKTVTGEVLGHIEIPNCNTYQKHHTVIFERSATVHGTQKYETVTEAAPERDLTSGPHASDTTTSSQEGTGHITYQNGDEVNLTC